MRRTVFIVLGMLWLCLPLLAQTESTLYFMNSIPQVTEANPSVISRYKTVIGLPVISSMAGVYTNNGFNYNDMVTTVNGKSQATLAKWSTGLAEKNYMEFSAQTDFFRVGTYLNAKWYLMVSATAKLYNRTMFQKALASVFVDGTSSLVNSYSNTSPTEDANAMMELNAGVAYKATSKLTLGGRLKFINGAVNVNTQSSSLAIQVDNNYQMHLSGSAVVQSSGWADLRANNYDLSSIDYGAYLKNNGWGLDLGVTYKVMDKLTLGASLTDLGFITWRNNTFNYTMDPATAKYTFSGFDINKLLDNQSKYFSSQLDTIVTRFSMKEASSGSYTTWLPTKFYLSGNYEIIKDLYLGTLFFGQSFKERFSAGMTAAVTKNFGKILSTTLSYTVSNRSYNNLGFGFSIQVQPIQFYFVGDNLLTAPASLLADQKLNSFINSAQLLTLRAGINLVFGLDKGGVKKEKKNDENHNPKKKKSGFGRSVK